MEIARLEELAANRYESVVTRQEDREELQRFLHDIRNQLLCAEAMDDKAARQTHLESLASKIGDLQSTRFTGNAALDALLNQKRSEAKRSSVDFSITPLAIPSAFMTSADICSLFGNAIDNAIECCLREPPSGPRFVDLRMAQVGSYLSVVVVNPCSTAPRPCKGGFASAKRAGKREGVGIASMKHVAKKYDGVVRFSFEDSRFSTTMLVPWRSAGGE